MRFWVQPTPPPYHLQQEGDIWFKEGKSPLILDYDELQRRVFETFVVGGQIIDADPPTFPALPEPKET